VQGVSDDRTTIVSTTGSSDPRSAETRDTAGTAPASLAAGLGRPQGQTGGATFGAAGEVDAPEHGLSDQEAARRRAAGQGNDVQVYAGRTYRQIVVGNVFNFINVLYFAIGIILTAVGRPLDAFVAVIVILANTLVSLAQEIRAKRIIDRIAILTRPKAAVVRDGAERPADPSDIVIGDLLRLRPGDQVVVDGRMTGPGRIEVDESLLTGESDLVAKTAGDELLSGSYCVTGTALYVAVRVGLDSFANKLTAKATSWRRELTPLQREVGGIIRALLIVVLVFNVLVWTRNVAIDLPFVEGVRMSAVIVALIPNGLVLSIALAYALGAVRMLGKGMLIQQGNAVESLSNVDVLCTDKTGTLTSNTIHVDRIVPLEGAPDDLERLLADYAATTTDVNRTIEALLEHLPGVKRRPASEALFSSRRKWSGLSFSEGELAGTYVLGAPEVVGARVGDDDVLLAEPTSPPPEAAVAATGQAARDTSTVPAWQEPSRWEWWPWARRRKGARTARRRTSGTYGDGPSAAGPETLAAGADQPSLFGDDAYVDLRVLAGDGGRGPGVTWRSEAERLSARGLRVLLFAACETPTAFADDPELPRELRPLALVSLRDELRPHVRETVEQFRSAGIELKILSGDNPHTVHALAVQAGLYVDRAGGAAPGSDEGPSGRIRVVPEGHADGGDDAIPTLSGTELATLHGTAFEDAAEETGIFGRITPEQKHDLLQALRRRGRYVAMIGDGVNDVIALKEANVSVAMNGGAQAARGVADLVLLHDSFEALPFAFREGQRILNGMNDILKMFMVRIFAKAATVGVVAAAGGFPFAPRQAAMLSFLAAGVPAIAFATWAKPGPVPRTSLFRRLVRFVLPAAVLQWLMTMGVYFLWAEIATSLYLAEHPAASEADLLEHALRSAQTATTLFATFCGILVVPLLAPPTRWWAGGAPLRRDWRFAALTLGLFALLFVFVATDLGRTLFELTSLPVYQYVGLGAAAFGWLMLVRYVWRRGLLDRWLGSVDAPPARAASARRRRGSSRPSPRGAR
jgi:magnesium-transporting ATPase (P-type)